MPSLPSKALQAEGRGEEGRGEARPPLASVFLTDTILSRLLPLTVAGRPLFLHGAYLCRFLIFRSGACMTRPSLGGSLC